MKFVSYDLFKGPVKIISNYETSKCGLHDKFNESQNKYCTMYFIQKTTNLIVRMFNTKLVHLLVLTGNT